MAVLTRPGPNALQVAAAWMGLDADHEHLERTEQAASEVADLLGCTDEICTHAVLGSSPHYVASLRIPGDGWAPRGRERLRSLADGAIVFEGGDWSMEVGNPRGRAVARTAIMRHARGDGGRATRFGGQTRLRGAMTVEAILATTAIDEVRIVGAAGPAAGVVETGPLLRPRYVGGRLTLFTTQMEGGRLQPVDVEEATAVGVAVR